MPGLLLWSADAPPVAELEARGAHVIEWRRWRSEAAEWLRSSSSGRRSLDPPARERIDALLTHDAVAVLGAQLASLDDVRCLHDTLLVPVLGAGVPLLVECSQDPEELDADQFIEPGFEHAHTIERMLWLCGRARAVDPRHAPAADVAPHRPLDDTPVGGRSRARGRRAGDRSRWVR